MRLLDRVTRFGLTPLWFAQRIRPQGREAWIACYKAYYSSLLLFLLIGLLIGLPIGLLIGLLIALLIAYPDGERASFPFFWACPWPD